MIDLAKYGEQYPDLVWDIWTFFADETVKSKYINKIDVQGRCNVCSPKCIRDFCETHSDKYKDLKRDNQMIQPRTVLKICNKLCEIDALSRFNNVGGFISHDGDMEFFCAQHKEPQDVRDKNKEVLKFHLNNQVYGFPYIYKNNIKNVRPIFVELQGLVKQSQGTCFNTQYGIVTARHCIENCSKIRIDGVSAALLKSAKIFGADGIDLVLISPQEEYNWKEFFVPSDCDVLDEIIVKGYPKHCGFEVMLTVTEGAIAGIGQSYLEKYKLMLLTGRIKGGNSGGPVISKKGFVVGTITETQEAQGDYDKFGYGMAIPINYMHELNEIENKYNFVDEL